MRIGAALGAGRRLESFGERPEALDAAPARTADVDEKWHGCVLLGMRSVRNRLEFRPTRNKPQLADRKEAPRPGRSASSGQGCRPPDIDSGSGRDLILGERRTRVREGCRALCDVDVAV